MASHWFPDSQRAQATTLASVAGPIGGAIGLLVPPVVLFIIDSIPVLLIFDAVISILSFLSVAFFFKSHPKHPPSITAMRQRAVEEQRAKEETSFGEFGKAIKTITRDKNYIILFLCYSFNLGAFQGLATLVSQITVPFGYSPGQSGVMGAVVVVFGVVGAFIVGKLMDKTRSYKLALFLCYACAWYFNAVWSASLAKDR